MQYTNLGNSDLKVSRICMGCMGFGEAGNGQHTWTVDEEHSREIIRSGLEGGINFFDTAIAYQSGTSEQYLGRALKDFAIRDQVTVATKFLPRTPEEIEKGVTAQQHIEQMINKSLENLGMDYVDLYIYHMWDYATPLYDIMDGLNRIVKAGKARYIGISNCYAYQLAKANALAEKEGFAKENIEKYLSLFRETTPDTAGIRYLLEKLDGALDAEYAENLINIIESVESVKSADFRLAFDPTLVRGMSYYTGPIFEISMDEFGGSVGGGGRYDEMIGRFTGQATPACGFSIGFERIVMLLLERGYTVPGAGQKVAYLIEKNMPAEKMREVLAKAKTERESGKQVNISVMKKNKKFQKDQLAAEGYTEIEEFFNR